MREGIRVQDVIQTVARLQATGPLPLKQLTHASADDLKQQTKISL